MGYTVNGTDIETDDQGYVLEPDYGDEIVRVIAAAEGLTLSDAHWKVVAYLRDVASRCCAPKFSAWTR